MSLTRWLRDKHAVMRQCLGLDEAAAPGAANLFVRIEQKGDRCSGKTAGLHHGSEFVIDEVIPTCHVHNTGAEKPVALDTQGHVPVDAAHRVDGVEMADDQYARSILGAPIRIEADNQRSGAFRPQIRAITVSADGGILGRDLGYHAVHMFNPVGRALQGGPLPDPPDKAFGGCVKHVALLIGPGARRMRARAVGHFWSLTRPLPVP